MRRQWIVAVLACSLTGLFGATRADARTSSPAVVHAAATPAVGRFVPLRLGSKGDGVRQVQEQLKANGQRVSPDGLFGRKTLLAVKRFQSAKGLVPDGIVGPLTWSALGLGAPPTAPPPTPPTVAPPTTTLPPVPSGSYTHPNPNVERWHDDALAAGWVDSDWPRLSCIMQRESKGLPTAKNPRSAAMGLLQIMWTAHSRWIGGESSQLLDGPTNLRIGRQLFERSGGWRPWVSTSSGC